MESRNLFSYVLQTGNEVGSLYQNSKADKRAVAEFMEANDWFNTEYALIDKAIHMTSRDLTAIRERLVLWLKAYKRSDREKTALLLGTFNDTYPETCRLYARFISDSIMADKPTSWKLLDFLFSEIDREITEYDESDLKSLAERLNDGATRKSAHLFAEFLGTAKSDGDAISCWTYAFGIRDRPAIVSDAYPMENFARMAYCVFNEEMWARNKLAEKAARNQTYADIWIFVALHFVCALRASDMRRLPAPAFPYDGETVLREITDGTFSREKAAALTENLRVRLKLNPMYPKKTDAQYQVPEIRLFVPESLTAPLGLMIAAALAHRPGIRAGDAFVKATFRLNNLRLFFGEDFMAALDGSGFAPRRCNKSYLQGVELAAGGEPGRPKGYMLAALARSHRSGIGRLSEITDAYLKDARFSGYSPEFIIRQMFERGVFSFIPAVLLEIYAGEEYAKLPITDQTKLIGVLGLTASRIEGLIETVERAMIRSRKAVGEMMNGFPNIAKSVCDMLQNIASGSAPGKQCDCLCLMTAAGFPCPFAGRDGCIGCGYEIYTKTTMYALMREYTWLRRDASEAAPKESWRYKLILKQAVMPAVAEMLTAAKLLYPNADIGGLLDIMEVEFDGTYGISGRD
ncbi:MAG: hypothetical protein LBO03_10485 [Acidaminococcales bacterium]|jgi:hypothetical protein|nr:hypothetical protein [Acidaminococcales bacterium]